MKTKRVLLLLAFCGALLVVAGSAGARLGGDFQAAASAGVPPTTSSTVLLTPSHMPTCTLSPTYTLSPTRTRTLTPTLTPTRTLTYTPSLTPTLTGTPPTFTSTPTVTSTNTHTPTFTVTNTPTSTHLPVYCGTVSSFAPAVTYPTGLLPSWVAIGDFNRDGHPDLATANTSCNGSTTSVLLNNGNGTFGAAVNYQTGDCPTAVAVGDLNGDGKEDLAVSSYGYGQVTVLLGNGDGTFWLRGTYSAGTWAQSAALADFNADGLLDVAVANAGTTQISVLRGNGDGSLQLWGSFVVGADPWSVAVGDFNGDNHTDIASANRGTNDVSVLMGNGDFTFRADATYHTDLGSFSVSVGDLNGDSHPDLLSTNANASSNNVSVLMNQGDGTFQPAANYPVQSDPRSAAIADYNGDGSLDLAVANSNIHGTNTVSVLLNNGDGTFQPAVHYASPSGPDSVAAGDLNGDGRPDLAVANYWSDRVSVHINICSVLATPTLTPTVTGTPPTATSTTTITPTRTATSTNTITNTPRPSPTLTGLAMETPVPPTSTFTFTRTPTPTLTPGPCVLPVAEDFESGTLGVLYSLGSPGWSAVEGNPHSGSFSAYAPDVDYVSEQQLVLAKGIPIPMNATQATLTFWHRYDFDIQGSTAWDGGILELSINSGPWNVPSFASGGLNGVLVNCPTLNPLAGRQAWVGSSGGWVQSSVDLMPYRGMSVRFRFRLGTSETVGGGGWWIDDVVVGLNQLYCWTPTTTATPCSPVPCTATVTRTPTTTPTYTRTSTPTPCNYDITASSGATIVPGTSMLNNHCDDCVTTVPLPFTYRLYGVSYSTVNISSNGNIQFTSSYLYLNTGCLPSGSLSNAILAEWEDLRTDQVGSCASYGTGGCGILTSVTGTAPNRVFNIEWRTAYWNDNLQLANFEIRLYEGQARFDIIYGRIDQNGASATTGVQKDLVRFSQFSCNTPDLSSGLIITYMDPCFPIITPTRTNTPTPTYTPTPTATPVLVGHVTWQGRPVQPNPLQQLPITLTLKSEAVEVNYPVGNTDATGIFTVPLGGIASGTYSWRVKGPKYLANTGTVVLQVRRLEGWKVRANNLPTFQPSNFLTANVEMGLMKAGDTDDNNVVNAGDFVIMKNTFGKSAGDPGYDDRADFTGDQWVSVADFNLLKVNFGQGGAPPIRPGKD